MIQDLSDLALGANRVLSYAGYVLLAGTFTFWSVVWPDGRRNRRLIALTLAGIAAMIIGTLAGPAIQLISGIDCSATSSPLSEAPPSWAG